MKKKITLPASIIIMLITAISSSGQEVAHSIQQEKKLIIGTWKEAEGDATLVFKKDGKLYWYNNDSSILLYSYKISNNPVQCGQKVQISKQYHTSFLELTDIKDHSTFCYEINGVGEKTMSLNGLGLVQINLFERIPDNKKRKP